MYNKIFKQIKKYNNIVIVRHISVDPDAYASQMALKDSIKLTFPNKNVFAVGAGAARFNYMGKLDKGLEPLENILLIVLDTPDKKRVDMDDVKEYAYSIKVDHHPYIETFCDLELIDDNKSSATELVYDLITNTKLMMDKSIAQKLYVGMVGDTNRFLYNVQSSLFLASYNLIQKYDIDVNECYNNLYKRPLSELQLLGYMYNNIKVTENGVGYIKIEDGTINKYQIDTISSGDLINQFNYVDELLIWISATEDVKNSCIRVSIRSRGPIINKVAEKNGGGGHKFASGTRVPSFEEVDNLIKDLDNLAKQYIEECDSNEN